MIVRSALILTAALALAPQAKAQGVFEPAAVNYVVCVTDETKKAALVTPPLAKDVVLNRAFVACANVEDELRKALTQQGLTASSADERLSQIKKFISQSADADIDRVRANVRPK